MTRSDPASTPDGPFPALAEHLVRLRRAARLTQRALAEAASISRGTVQRAESGSAAPSPTVLDAYLRACRASAPDQTRARLLRDRGRTGLRGRLPSLNAPKPALIHTEDDLGAALAAAYERAGAPSLRELSRRVPHRPPLPPTTAWRIVHRKGLPASLEQLVTFLTACGVSPAEQRLYAEAYSRFCAVRGVRVTPAPPPRLSHYTDKISPRFRNLLDSLSAGDVETALAIGVAYVVAERVRRNGAALPGGVDAVSFSGWLCADEDELLTRFPDGAARLLQRRYPPGAALHARSPEPPPPPAPVPRAA
ncbi:helix-turn-helix transcriptional regulator [Streptomyces sp. SCL15-4]|uniref:helix-turn-helix domain-containing protein n=1 Tax=Streptomyces sp. SCL15-4 TaxID=2967221 RepID=UPI002966904D|nr:helix-turn-helix transcriptional regulator [Streptomyces sp. SCL15-4]